MPEIHEVTACIVTRGDVDLTPIIESLIFGDVIVWDNSVRPDWKVAGRYFAALEATTELVYFQDDDTIVPEDTQLELLSSCDGYDCYATWGHGDDPAGYGDLPLVCGGAIVDTRAAWDCIARYGAWHPLDSDFMYEADFVVGSLYRQWAQVELPFHIRDVAYNGQRLADEPWQRQLKFNITARARAIRDRERITA